MSIFEIKHRFTSTVLFSAELSAKYDGEAEGVRLGAAVKLAVKARANLAGADLARADLAGADLAGAYLAGADLAGADLACADLARADLAGADLAGADLARAYLAGANVAGVKDIIGGGFPDGWPCWAYREKGTGLLCVRAGCRAKTLVEGRAYWAGKEDRREVLAALDYIEAVARLRGWKIDANTVAA